jgi:hypothetical protein
MGIESGLWPDSARGPASGCGPVWPSPSDLGQLRLSPCPDERPRRRRPMPYLRGGQTLERHSQIPQRLDGQGLSRDWRPRSRSQGGTGSRETQSARSLDTQEAGLPRTSSNAAPPGSSPRCSTSPEVSPRRVGHITWGHSCSLSSSGDWSHPPGMPHSSRRWIRSCPGQPLRSNDSVAVNPADS